MIFLNFHLNELIGFLLLMILFKFHKYDNLRKKNQIFYTN